MKPIALAALLSFLPGVKAEPPTKPIDVDRLIVSLNEIEQGKWGTPGGILNISYALWSDYSKMAYQLSGNRYHALIVYKLAIHGIMARLARIGHPVTVEAVATCWNEGFEGARRQKFRTSFGTRTSNLYHDTSFNKGIP